MSSDPPNQLDILMEQLTRNLTWALIYFSLAWAFLTIGVFTFYPIGPGGIFFLCLGLPCVAASIFFFVRYELTSRKIWKMRS